MIGERNYMHRNPSFYRGFKAQYPAVFWILAINIAIFIIELLSSRWFGSEAITNIFSLSLGGLERGYVWEFFTYSMLHGGIFHLLCNMLAIFFIGRFVEATLEKRNFIILYLMGVFLGALAWIASIYIFSPHINAYLVGASAGAFALVTFFCLASPNRAITFFLFFIIPISLKPRVMLYILIGFEVLSSISMSSTVANSAHLGGILGGYIFYILFKANFFSGMKLSIFKPKSRRMSASDLKYSINMVDVEELKNEANKILEKVEKSGLNSLSEEERNVLKQYREYI